MHTLFVCHTFIAATSEAQSDCCPVFGTNQSASLTPSTLERAQVFLNFEAPSQCRGNVTSWSFCHYTSAGDNHPGDNVQYAARLIVYRRADPTSTIYEPVAGSTTSIRLSYDDARMGFRCLREDVSQSFEIQENDVIGACVWDEGTSIYPLRRLIGKDDESPGQKLYQYNRNDYEMCTGVDTGFRNFVQRSQFRLHVYADTGTYMQEGYELSNNLFSQMLQSCVGLVATLLPLDPSTALSMARTSTPWTQQCAVTMSPAGITATTHQLLLSTRHTP